MFMDFEQNYVHSEARTEPSRLEPALADTAKYVNDGASPTTYSHSVSQTFISSSKIEDGESWPSTSEVGAKVTAKVNYGFASVAYTGSLKYSETGGRSKVTTEVEEQQTTLSRTLTKTADPGHTWMVSTLLYVDNNAIGELEATLRLSGSVSNTVMSGGFLVDAVQNNAGANLQGVNTEANAILYSITMPMTAELATDAVLVEYDGPTGGAEFVDTVEGQRSDISATHSAATVHKIDAAMLRHVTRI